MCIRHKINFANINFVDIAQKSLRQHLTFCKRYKLLSRESQVVSKYSDKLGGTNLDYPCQWKAEFTTKNGKKVVFRPEQSSDTEMLWEMFSTLSKESVSNLLPPFTRERVEGWTRNINYDEVLAIVAVIEENGQRIIGSSSLKFSSQEPIRHKAELGISIHDDYQNMGIGTALLNHLINVASMKKLSKVWLHVSTSNSRAIHVYKKAGFTIEGKLCKESYVNGEYRDEYSMALFL
jgi:L-phenylalanine/L-methionine N-acetyltransferase